MTDQPSPDPDAEKRAVRRFAILNAVRIGSLLAVMAGIAGAQNVIAMPFPLAVALALAGFLGFFFGPYYLAKYFKGKQ